MCKGQRRPEETLECGEGTEVAGSDATRVESGQMRPEVTPERVGGGQKRPKEIMLRASGEDKRERK